MVVVAEQKPNCTDEEVYNNILLVYSIIAIV